MNNLLILFAKEPEINQVKTRLIPVMGKQGSYKLYCELVKTMLNRFKHFFNCDFTIYTNNKKSLQQSFFYPNNIKYQQGQDIGEKMHHAMAHELLSYKKVILFGADCPFITHSIMKQVIESLDHYDQVFIPAHDGGYVLIGATKISPELFLDIFWSSSKVMYQTCNKIELLGYSYHLLPPLHDIDDENDLPFLKHKLE